MNCKPGDLAVVRSGCRTPGISGRIVTVVRQVAYGETFLNTKGKAMAWRHQCDGWVIESSYPLPWKVGNSDEVGQFNQRGIADAILRPIRDQPGDDETLTWAGKPQEVKA